MMSCPLHKITGIRSIGNIKLFWHYIYIQDLETTNEILKDTIEFLRSGVQNNLLDRLNTVMTVIIMAC